MDLGQLDAVNAHQHFILLSYFIVSTSVFRVFFLINKINNDN